MYFFFSSICVVLKAVISAPRLNEVDTEVVQTAGLTPDSAIPELELIIFLSRSGNGGK